MSNFPNPIVLNLDDGGPTDGQVPAWDAAAGVFRPATVGGGGGSVPGVPPDDTNNWPVLDSTVLTAEALNYRALMSSFFYRPANARVSGP